MRCFAERSDENMGEENGDSVENIIYPYFLNRTYRVRRRKIFTLFVFFRSPFNHGGQGGANSRTQYNMAKRQRGRG